MLFTTFPVTLNYVIIYNLNYVAYLVLVAVDFMTIHQTSKKSDATNKLTDLKQVIKSL